MRIKRTAFTLIELLVVIAIIAILMGILMPSLAKARIMASRSLCANNVKQIYIATALYTQDYKNRYPAINDPIPGTSWWLWMGRGFRGFVKPYLDNQEGKTSVLSCPGDKTAIDKYEATSYAYSMTFYHSPQQIDSITSLAGTYSNPLPTITQSTGDVANPAKKIIYGEWLSNHEKIAADSGWWVWDGTRNFVMADGHVEFVKAVDIQKANDGLPDPNLTKNGIKGSDLK